VTNALMNRMQRGGALAPRLMQQAPPPPPPPPPPPQMQFDVDDSATALEVDISGSAAFGFSDPSQYYMPQHPQTMQMMPWHARPPPRYMQNQGFMSAAAHTTGYDQLQAGTAAPNPSQLRQLMAHAAMQQVARYSEQQLQQMWQHQTQRREGPQR
jgi:hypothetical protein